MPPFFFPAPWTEGLKRALPITLGYLPVGFAFGVLAVKNGLTPGLSVAMSVLMFSGSGQFVFAGLWGGGASPLSVTAAVAIINLRYLLMSAAEAPWLAPFGRLKRFLLGFGVTDETFVVHAASLDAGWKLNSTTMFVCNQTAQLAWVLGSAIGAFCGDLVNDARPLGLDYAITAMFIALLAPQFTSGLHVLVAVFTGALSVALKISGFGDWNVAAATVAGATLGLILHSKTKREPK